MPQIVSVSGHLRYCKRFSEDTFILSAASMRSLESNLSNVD